MKTYHEDFAAELNKSFPKTPERFRRMVEQEAYAHSAAARKNREKKAFKPFKALIPAAACLLLAGGTAAAANLPVFQKWIAGMQHNAQTVEESIVHKGEIGYPIPSGLTAKKSATDYAKQAEPPFTVTDAYYDGSTLMFWADPAGDYFDLGDHVYINGVDSRLEYVAETVEDSGIYECKVTIVDETLQKTDTDTINVKVSLYTDSHNKTDYSFTVESPKLGTSTQVSGNEMELDFGKLVSYDVSIAPSVINLHLDWEVKDDSIAELLQWGYYILADASGNRLTPNEWMRSVSCTPAEHKASSTSVSFSQDLEIIGFDATSPTITLIPIREARDENGYELPESEEILEDYAVTISLTS
ncbi:MAG: hypothetical protein NC081_03615 [Roseburia sp.]|nr:hypothetical protein [Roseburia sp.]